MAGDTNALWAQKTGKHVEHFKAGIFYSRVYVTEHL